MKNLILTSIFIISTLFSIAQKKINFMIFNYKTMDISNNPNVSLEKLNKIGPSGTLDYSNGFNHYEIDINKKVLIHTYSDEKTGQGEKYDILNLVKTDENYSFNIKSKNSSEKIYFLIPLIEDSKYKLLVKYKENENTKVSFFDSSSFVLN